MNTKLNHKLSTGRKRKAKSAPPTLLYSRWQTGQVLGGISEATVKRKFELTGMLKVVRHGGTKTGPAFHEAQRVHELAAQLIAEAE